MAKAIKKSAGKKAATKKAAEKKLEPTKSAAAKARRKKAAQNKPAMEARPGGSVVELRPAPPQAVGASSAVLDRLWSVVVSRRDADPAVSHSARLLSRGRAKIAQKFGEEAVECLIEAAQGNAEALVAESADVLYHLLVMWVDAGVRPDQVWAELQRREGISGVAEKAARVRALPMAVGLRTTKIP